MDKLKPKPIRSLDDLTDDPKNANRGTERGRAIIRNSMEKRGTGRSVVTDADGVIIAGKNAVQVAREQGKKILVVDTEGDTLLVHRRIDLKADDEKAQILGIEDNRSSEMGLDWDEEELQEKASAGIDIEDAGWEEAEFIELVGHAEDVAGRAPATSDGTPRAAKAPLVKIVVRVTDLPIFEEAMRRTGISNRGDSLIRIANAFLGQEGDAFEEDL